MIKALFRHWIIFWIIFGTSYAFDVQCPIQGACSCHPSHNGDIEIHCPTENDSAFIVNIQPDEYIQIQCHNSPQWNNFHLSNLLATKEVKSIYFRMCGLPTNLSLEEIPYKLGVKNIEKLVFQSFGNLSTTLSKKHLEGFPNLQKLILSSNGLTNLSSDVFEGVPNLTWLDLRENNVQLFPGIFANTPKLEILELGNNMMENIEPGIFDSLIKLKFLNLWRNKFTTIKPGTFDKLVSLNSLDLNSNELTTLNKDVFIRLKNLEALNLFLNNFSSLPEGLLQHNVKLRTVNLFSNRRNMTNLPKGLFANLTELKSVQLKRNGLISVPADLFHGCIKLKNISLERNYLEALPKDLFKGLSNLLVLELNFNELTSLPNMIFSHLKNLIRLDLSKNHFTSISGHLFSNLRSLQVLKMKDNKLKVIDDTSFNSLANLRIAIFSNNELTFNTSLAPFQDEYGKKSPFHACSSLEELYLDRNNISEIFGDWTIDSVKLRILDLKFNQIRHISSVDMQFVSSHIEVDLRHNQIEHIFLAGAEEISRYQQNPRDVIILVDNNPIACDCMIYDFLRYLEGRMHPYVQNYFHIIPGGLTCHSPERLTDIMIVNLKSKMLQCEVLDPCPKECTCWLRPNGKIFLVDCSNKNLTTVPRNIPILPEFRLELNFEGNKLTRMSPLVDIGLNNASISKLLLSNNSIYDISVNELPMHIEVLALDNNKISKLNSTVLQFMNNTTSLMKLTLHGNPWTCNCDALDFLNFIQTKVKEIPDLSLITCKDMTVSMLKMVAADLCPVQIMMIVGISMAIAVTGLLIGSVAALYYRYQQEIKVWLYAHKYCLWLVTEDELDKDKLYDAFISYSHKDEDFIINKLVPELENGENPFKLCLHFRDWQAGEYIPRQIVHSVENSRRTIVVLSPNFLESVWGRMEFRAAHHQALNESRARVILILYGDIGPTNDLDEELKAYLNMNTYVKWGDPWFWNKLRYALPHPPELTKYTIKRKKVFENHKPFMQVNGEKELIYSVGGPETPPAASTPPADTLKVFTCDEKVEGKQKRCENLSPTESNVKFILSSEELIKHNLMNKVQCTTV